MTYSNFLILTISFIFGSLTFAKQEEVATPKRLGAEFGVLHLVQNSDGNTTTIVPMLNFRIWNYNQVSLRSQVGATVYKDASTDKTFSVALLRLNPNYQFTNRDLSLEGILGLQQWEGRGLKADYGLRVNYGIKNLSKNFLDEAFAGGGTVLQDNVTNYFTVGVKKWF